MRILLLTAAALMLGGGAYAAEPIPKAVLRGVTQAPLEQSVSPAAGGQINTEEGDSSVAFKYGWTQATGKGFGTDSSVGIFSSFSVAASAPLTDGSDNKPASLDALASGAVLEAKYSRLWITRAPRTADRGNKMMAYCRPVLAAHPEIPADTCHTELIATYAPANLEAFQELIWGKKPTLTVLGISGRAGQQTFDYLDPVTLAERSMEKSSWSVKAFWAHRPLNQPWIVTLGLEHQDAFEDAETQVLCPAGAAPTACVEGPAGAPQKVRKDIVSAEYRRDFGIVSGAAGLQYDVNNDVLAAEIPIYLIRNKDGELNGGVKFSWRSDTDEVVSGIFFGTTFSLGVPAN